MRIPELLKLLKVWQRSLMTDWTLWFTRVHMWNEATCESVSKTFSHPHNHPFPPFFLSGSYMAGIIHNLGLIVYNSVIPVPFHMLRIASDMFYGKPCLTGGPMWQQLFPFHPHLACTHSTRWSPITAFIPSATVMSHFSQKLKWGTIQQLFFI